MTLKYAVELRNHKLGAFEAAMTSGILLIRTGPPPATPALASTGTVLATVNIPADFLNVPAGGVVTKNAALLQDLSADNTGVAGHFRILNNSGLTCVMQGTVGTAGADMIVDTVNFVAGQIFNVVTFTITEGNP